MNFTITHNNPLNTELIGPGVSYTISSPGLTKKQTTISRGGAPVAQIDWHSLSSDVLRMPVGGAEVKVGDFLRRAGVLSSKREFVAGGQTYTWKPSGRRMELHSGSTPIATMERHALHASTLQVSQAAGSILDTLIVSMVIMWKLQQQSDGGGDGGDGGDGGGGDGGGGGGGGGDGGGGGC